MFNFFKSFNSIGFTGLGVLTPKYFINYNFDNTFQVSNQMYSKNLGNSGLDLALHSGQGVEFNGTNQSIGINKSISTTSTWTISFKLGDPIDTNGYIWWFSGSRIIWVIGDNLTYYDGVNHTLYDKSNDSTIDVTLVAINNNISVYINGSLVNSVSVGSTYVGELRGIPNDNYYSGILKDLYVFNDTLTQAEITKYSTNPNDFFQDVQDGVIDNCVLNMPMDGVDENVIDYANYSEGANDFTTFNILGVGWTDNLDGSYSIDGTNLASSYCTISDGTANEIYLVSYTISNYVSGGAKLFPGNEAEATLYSGNGDCFEVVKSLSTTLAMKAHGVGCEFMISNIEFKPLSGIHEITNYTDSCRDNAKQLPYGTQEANFLHTDIGIPLRGDISEYFESSEFYDNYGDTGYMVSDSDTTFESVIENKITDNIEISIGGYKQNRLYMGISSGGRVYLRYGNSTYIALADLEYLHLVIVSNKTDNLIKFYVNGIEVLSEAYSFLLSTAYNITIGGINGGTTYHSTSPIRLFKVHKKALTQEEVTTTYNDAVNKGLLT